MRDQPFHFSSSMKLSGLVVAALVIGSLIASRAQALATFIGSWDYVVRHDPDGRPQAAFARLQGVDDSLLWLTCSRYSATGEQPQIVSMAAAVSQKGYLGHSSVRGRSTVYWFDGGSPELGYWIYRGRIGQIADQEQVNLFLDRIASAQTLTVELSNYRLEPLRSEFQFDTADTKTVADKFRQDCRTISGLAGEKTSWNR
ncbi:hypothetical protein [Microvirga solisilvae]|uniref:hypothetical protein n=1 Tax=Microvirga solisilvae TaxID=2919498 RepID=UPI001FAFCF04|nr:hypothetical protein [Microvirga solisilvae]